MSVVEMRSSQAAIEQLRWALRSDQPRSRIHMIWDRPTVDWPGDHGVMEHASGPNTMFVIEGENELVQPYLDAVREVYEREQKLRPDVYRP